MTDLTDAEMKQKLWSMMKDIGTAMLTTEDDGKLRARPMVASQTEFKGELWFFTRKSSHKVDEVKSEQHVGVSYADAGKQDYVSLSGRATLVTDKAQVTAHWDRVDADLVPEGDRRSRGRPAQGRGRRGRILGRAEQHDGARLRLHQGAADR